MNLLSREVSMPPASADFANAQVADAARDRAKIAEEISVHTLALAQRARAAGLMALSHALEAAALEAATVCWPGDADS